ncbi:glycine zipper 2TM domain-containing protein [Photobacterium sp. WH77]|uniref:glycine zipper 2TM domain-containing protein n=1 Tax=unclassified Photobacterium TaxID=2628852 RepID=UPI001ED9E8D2|nr:MULTISPECIES: glycine zipper 2TM domain-containing protein [unclassified Photobacterium]MCG2835834.1 glycine zipper 2TM domain-containing protein [Photobacterium sp. WH77]MCG2843489.1 glycine zipper 2TM domain-containing protein [Photobacterium sp. WH80]
MRKWLWFVLLFSCVSQAAPYNRNQARPVNQVVFGQLETVRYITQQQVVNSEHNGWQTLLGAVVGGLIGNQFGGGHGREVATTVGALAGAGVAYQNQHIGQSIRQYKLVELLIKTDDGKLVDVIQVIDPNMLFQSGDNVRILYFDEGVRVDRTYP